MTCVYHMAYMQTAALLVNVLYYESPHLELFFESGPLLLLFVAFGRLLEHIAKVLMREVT